MRKNHRPSKPQAAFESLEPRLLLSSDSLSYGPLGLPHGLDLNLAFPPPDIEIPVNPPAGDATFVAGYENIPDYEWWYGCVPTASGMQVAWWDQQLKLTNPDDSVFPGDPLNWLYGQYTAQDPGTGSDVFMVPDYANGVIAGWPHVYDGDDWIDHVPDSIADFVLTQASVTATADIPWGLQNFVAWDDPRTPENESWLATTGTIGDAHTDLSTEIDNGNPVQVWLVGTDSNGIPVGEHAVLAVGYYVDPDNGDEFYELYTTWNWGLQQWSWAGQEIDGITWTPGGGMTMSVAPIPATLTGYLAVSHPQYQDLTVEIGLGDPSAPDWSTTVTLPVTGNNNLVMTDVDLSAGLTYLVNNPGTPENWHLKVVDGAPANAGEIMDFQIRYGDNRWFTPDVGTEILDDATPAYAYLTTSLVGQISGTKWHDLDGDGLRDGGEPGLQGWEIFLDTDSNGVLDPGETSTTTDVNGDYTFTGLVLDTYTVTEVLQADWYHSAPGGAYISVLSGQSITGIDFGNYQLGQISGLKWHDLNQDGVIDGGEPVLADWIVFLDEDDNGILDWTDADDDQQWDAGEGERFTLTDVNGEYSFADLAPGSYVVAEVLQDVWLQTEPDTQTYEVDLTSNADVQDQDFGNYLPGLPDLVDGGSANSTFSPAIVSPGASWGLDWRVTNNGTAGAGEFTVSFYASRDNDAETTEDNHFLASTVVSSLAASASINLDVSVPNFPLVPAGDYYVAAVIDSEMIVVESLEDNNTAVDDGYPLRVPGIRGTKWADLNEDGIQDPGEPVLAGITIYLDINDNGILDGPDISTTTDVNGQYYFTNLGPDTYVVSEDLQAGWTQTLPVAGGSYEVLVGSDQLIEDIDFGNLPGPNLLDDGDLFSLFSPGTVYSPGSSWDVWWDIRNEGTADAGEFRVDFWATVDDDLATLGDNFFLGSVVVPGIVAGNYADINLSLLGFPEIAAGVYYVGIIIDPDNQVPEYDETDNTGIDLDNYPLVVLNRPDLIESPSSLSDFSPTVVNPGDQWQTFWTVENTGLADAGDFWVDFYASVNASITSFDHLLGRVRVPNGLAAGESIDLALSMLNFPVIPAGEYYVGVIIDGNNQVVESDETNNVAVSQTHPLLVAGVRGTLWHDKNADGIVDNDEPGLPGWIIYLDTNDNSLPDVGETMTITDLNGQYSFPDLPTGDYTVREVPMALDGWEQTFPGNGGEHDVSYVAGEFADDIDFFNAMPSRINGLAWHDIDGDGEPDEDLETDILVEWTVFLDSNGNETLDPGEDFVITDNTGLFEFKGYFPDLYLIRLQIQPGYVVTIPEFGLDLIDVTSAHLYESNFGAATAAQFSGRKWHDLNADGIKGANEPGLENWVIYIDADDDGQLDGDELQTTTDADGLYQFTGLIPGEYIVREVLQDDWVQSYPEEAFNTVVLNSGATITGVNFGNYQLGQVSGLKWHDLDADGTYKPDEEPGLADWTIELDGEGVQLAVLTDEDGNYIFTDIEPGTYTISEVLQPGWVQSGPSSLTYTVTIRSGGIAEDRNFGNYVPGSISGRKWEDLDGSGVADAGQLNLSATFQGISDTGELPPDPIAAAGPSNLVAMVNSAISIFSKFGATIASAPLGSGDGEGTGFFEEVDSGFGAFDPWVIYDRYSERYIVMAEEVDFDADQANLLIGISTSDRPDDLDTAPGDTDDDWYVYSIPATHDFGNGLAWIDYPKISADADSLYITGNYCSFENDEFQGVRVTRLDKADMLTGTLGARTDIEADDEYVFTLQPAQSVGRSADDPQLLVDSFTDVGLGITVWELDGSNVLSEAAFLPSPYTWRSEGVPQLGSSETLDAVGGRLMNAVWRNDSIWTAHTIDLNDEATVRWYQIDTSGGTYSLTQTGDIDPGPGIHTFMPAITVDVDGNVGITYTQSSASQYAAMMFSGRLSTDPAGYTLPGTVVKAGEGPFEELRWGDYGGISVDPSDDATFWSFHEYPVSLTEWGTWWGAYFLAGVAGGSGLQGWTIFLDQNENGILDQGETSTTTDENGNYTFTDLIPGTYIVAEVLQSGWVQSAPLGSNHTVTIVSGQNSANNGFGNYQLGEVHGVKWHDIDGDGEMDLGDGGLDPGEPTLEGWVIFLDEDENGLLDWTDGNGDSQWDDGEGERFTTTDADGNYAFTDLSFDNYTVTEELVPGWVQSFPEAGTYAVQINQSGQILLGNDFGNLQPGQISGTKWEDTDGDGTQNGAELGLEGWIIFLDDDDNGILDWIDGEGSNGVWDEGEGERFTTTDADGNYAFDDLLPGTYTVAEQLQAGWTQSAPAEVTYEVEIISGQVEVDKDFGNVQAGTISGRKWSDLNADGIKDAGEDYLAGWSIKLFIDTNGNGELDPGEAINPVTAVTNALGEYEFTGLLPGDYIVAEVLQNGWFQTFPADDIYDVTITAGLTVPDQDFANVQTATISGYKWEDLNADGIKGDGEPALQDWIIYLDINDNDQLDAGESTDSTDQNGFYEFTLLLPDTYIVAEELQAGWTQSAPDTETHELTVAAADVVENINFGNWSPASIAGTKWSDTNRDTIKDPGESGIEDWVIFLDEDGNGQLDWTDGNGNSQWDDGEGERFTTTDVDGNYLFDGLEPGEYTVAEVLVTGWEQTFPAGVTHLVTVQSNEEVISRHFGNWFIEGTVDDDVDVDEDSGVNIIDVLANDVYSNPPGVTVVSVTAASDGQALVGPGGLNVTYEPDPDYLGPDSFTYTVTGSGGELTATVNITVIPQPDLPDAVDDDVSVEQYSGPNDIDVLNNDTYLPDEPEDLLVTGITQGTFGVVAITGGGTGVTYDPTGGFFGSDTFTYTLTDEDGLTDTATVNVTVVLSPGITVEIDGITVKSAFYTDDDGSEIKVRVKGPGIAVLNFVGPDPSVVVSNGKALIHGSAVRLAEIAFSDTTTRTVVTITVKKGDGLATLDKISGDSPVGKVTAKLVDLLNVGILMTGNGYIGSSFFHQILADVVMPGTGAGSKGISITAQSLGAGVDLTLGSYLKLLKANFWTGSLITAPWANSIIINGNFGADVTLTGVGLPANKKILNKATIFGDIIGGTWNLNGIVGTIKAASIASSWTFDAAGSVVKIFSSNDLGGIISALWFKNIQAKDGLTAQITAAGKDKNGVSLCSLKAGGLVENVSLNLPGGAKVVDVGEWRDTDATTDELNLAWLKTLKSKGRRANLSKGITALTGHFQADVILSAIGLAPNKPTINSAKIYGNLTGGSWRITGIMGTLTVFGTVQQSTIRSTDTMKGLTLGAADGSDFLAGINGAVGRHAVDYADFDDLTAAIKKIIIKGPKLPSGTPLPRCLLDSYFSAAYIGPVTLKNAQFDNGGTYFGLFARNAGSPVGVAGTEIKTVKHTDTAGGPVWTKKLTVGETPGEVFRDDDFIISVL